LFVLPPGLDAAALDGGLDRFAENGDGFTAAIVDEGVGDLEHD